MSHSRKRKPKSRATIARRVIKSKRENKPKEKMRGAFPAATTPKQFEQLRRQMKIREHLNAIQGAQDALLLMGQKWVDNVVTYRIQCLERLGYKVAAAPGA